MNVPDTFSLRMASPSATWPLSADTTEYAILFCALMDGRADPIDVSATTTRAPVNRFIVRPSGPTREKIEYARTPSVLDKPRGADPASGARRQPRVHGARGVEAAAGGQQHARRRIRRPEGRGRQRGRRDHHLLLRHPGG